MTLPETWGQRVKRYYDLGLCESCAGINIDAALDRRVDDPETGRTYMVCQLCGRGMSAGPGGSSVLAAWAIEEMSVTSQRDHPDPEQR